MSEFALQKAVVQHLRLRQRPGVYWAAIPNGEARSARTGGKLKAMGVRAGAPDLFIIAGGKANALELKSSKGRLSPAQKDTMKTWRLAGGSFYSASTLNDALGILTDIGAIYPDLAASKTIRETEGEGTDGSP